MPNEDLSPALPTAHQGNRGIFSCLEFSTLKYLQSFEPQSAEGYCWIADVCGYRRPQGCNLLVPTSAPLPISSTLR